jgi:hypothetical protein
MKFPLGQTVSTARVSESVPFNIVLACLRRHASGDWGDMSKQDIASNEFGLANGERLFSSYKLPEPIDGEDKVWVITEWDRSVTTVLFPSDY